MSRLKTYLLLGLACLAGIAVAATNYTPVGTTYYTSVSLPSKGDALTADSVSTPIKLALNNIAYVKAQAEAGTYGGATSEPRVIRSALTLGTSYEIRNSQLALTRFKTFSRVARSYTIAGASTQYGWTTDANFTSTNLSAANEDTTTNDALRLAHKAVNTTYNIASRTAPTMYRTVNVTSDDLTIITARIKMNGQTANGQQGGIIMVQNDDNSKLIAAWCGYIGGAHKCESYTAGAGAPVTLSSATLTAGVWMQIISQGLGVYTRYSTANQATPPNDWTFLQANDSLWSNRDKALRMGLVLAGTTAGAITMDVPYYDTQVNQDVKAWNYSDLGDDWAAQGFDSTSPAIQLIADWDIGQGTPSQAKLRQILADAVNQLEPGTTSTWTFSAVCSSSLGASAGSYAAAASVTLTDTGDYCNLWAKATSDGYYPATLDVDSITMPITP